ncbi:toll/interleukin-1 receptor domain-containing protein [Acetobacterium sp.]|uniref:toll/interleukin-1 receptor domain-containing protein n=1 Tax=Acetobacterium sp. TaxID=1872094 RepID=UPI003593136D
MKNIFESREFSQYQVSSLYESKSTVIESYQFSKGCSTVFLSHKHADLDDLKDIVGFLEKEYPVKVYIDSRDTSMPQITCGKTAENIKNRIRQCKKFILLATNGAIDSKWCNWELGFGDAQKFQDHIALFPIKPKDAYDSSYRGTEHMSIYPYIPFMMELRNTQTEIQLKEDIMYAQKKTTDL